MRQGCLRVGFNHVEYGWGQIEAPDAIFPTLQCLGSTTSLFNAGQLNTSFRPWCDPIQVSSAHWHVYVNNPINHVHCQGEGNHCWNMVENTYNIQITRHGKEKELIPQRTGPLILSNVLLFGISLTWLNKFSNYNTPNLSSKINQTYKISPHFKLTPLK